MPGMTIERIYVSQLRPNETVDQIFLVRDKDLRTTKTGGLYVQCTLGDRSGTITGRMWQATESIYESIPVGGFLQIKGRIEDYRGTLQLIFDACMPVGEAKVAVGDFIPTTTQDVEAMWTELLAILRTVQDKHLRLLVKKFVEDSEFVAAFKAAPAAMQMHHPFVGGLLEHTLGVARAARALLKLYPKLNADLVTTGVFLHDMGKTAELVAAPAPGYTERGQLVGHITIAAIWLEKKADRIAEETGEPFPPRLLNVLQHMVLSHHGIHDYGSPKLPMFPEAIFLHYLDDLDAKMFMTVRDIETDHDAQADFTAYNRTLERRLFKHSRNACGAGDGDKQGKASRKAEPKAKPKREDDAPPGELFGQ